MTSDSSVFPPPTQSMLTLEGNCIPLLPDGYGKAILCDPQGHAVFEVAPYKPLAGYNRNWNIIIDKGGEENYIFCRPIILPASMGGHILAIWLDGSEHQMAQVDVWVMMFDIAENKSVMTPFKVNMRIQIGDRRAEGRVTLVEKGTGSCNLSVICGGLNRFNLPHITMYFYPDC